MVVKDTGNSSQNLPNKKCSGNPLLGDSDEDMDVDVSSMFTDRNFYVKDEQRDDGSKVKSVKNTDHTEMVDRGVGPTPVPDHVLEHVPLPPFFGIPSFLPDPRNHMFELPIGYTGYPYVYPPLTNSFCQPMSVNSNTNNGRHHLSTSIPFFSSSANGISSSNVASESLRSQFHAVDPASIASRLQWEHYQRMVAFQHSPYSMHHHNGGIIQSSLSPFQYRFSPISLSRYPDGYMQYKPFSPHPAFAASAAAAAAGSQRSIFGDHPGSPGSGSITLPGSLESSRLTSPHPSSVAGKLNTNGRSRKRALSQSPFDFGLDIESLTRSSDGSLQLPPFGRVSQSSSNASGSYGHLSAVSLNALGSSLNMFGHAALRHGAIPLGAVPPGMLYNPLLHPCFLPYMSPSNQILEHPQLKPSSTSSSVPKTVSKKSSRETGRESSSQPDKESSSEPGSIVSSTVSAKIEPRKNKLKREDCHPGEFLNSTEHVPDEGNSSPSDKTLQESEPDFYETNCRWKDCNEKYETQDELVKHVNRDHVASNKKAFTCEWEDCERKKPFKAQYMLVVHMRRHTGEKPHHCLFEGCNKAYSRLENLKTHLRSHTGEKPYLCEFPGCSKAFSNASDRAKHQNRTHSDAKPYACKAPGCEKRYTDPSSLRKHVKTVHGTDFYVNKKHKGESFSGDDGQNNERFGNKSYRTERQNLANQKKSDTINSNGKSESGIDVMKVGDCLTVTSLQAIPSLSTSSLKKNADGCDGTARKPKTMQRKDVLPQTTTRCQQIEIESSAFNSNNIGGEQMLSEAEENLLNEFLELPSVAVGIVEGSSSVFDEQGLPPTRMRATKCHPKLRAGSNMSTLPPLGNVLMSGKQTNAGFLDQRKIIETKPGNVFYNKKMINASLKEIPYNSRRDSNTSTLSSYMSSIRSDSSPCPPLFSFHSSRRGSESSQNSTSQRSIAPSPYEYDIPDNPGRIAAYGSLTSRLARTKLRNSTASLTESSANDRGRLYGNGNTTRFMNSQRGGGLMTLPPINDGYMTPCRTPLPHEIPNHDIRRASDPVHQRCLNSFGVVREFQRCHSFTVDHQHRATRSPYVSQMMSSDMYSDYAASSRTSIATDLSQLSEADVDDGTTTTRGRMIGQRWSTIDEAVLEQKMLEDAIHNDLLIPDEVQEYLDANCMSSGGVGGGRGHLFMPDEGGANDLVHSSVNGGDNRLVLSDQQTTDFEQIMANEWNESTTWPIDENDANQLSILSTANYTDVESNDFQALHSMPFDNLLQSNYSNGVLLEESEGTQQCYENKSGSYGVKTGQNMTLGNPIQQQNQGSQFAWTQGLSDQRNDEEKRGRAERQNEVNLMQELSINGSIFPTDDAQMVYDNNTCKVTSNTDVSMVTSNEEIDQLADALGFLDNLGSISLQNLIVVSPTMLTNGSSSTTTSRMTTPRVDAKSSSSSAQCMYVNSGNMVVNDMNSVLAELEQETKFLSYYG